MGLKVLLNHKYIEHVQVDRLIGSKFTPTSIYLIVCCWNSPYHELMIGGQ